MEQGRFPCVFGSAVLELERAIGGLLGFGSNVDVRASKPDCCGRAASVFETAKNRLELMDNRIPGVFCCVVHESDYFP